MASNPKQVEVVEGEPVDVFEKVSKTNRVADIGQQTSGSGRREVFEAELFGQLQLSLAAPSLYSFELFAIDHAVQFRFGWTAQPGAQWSQQFAPEAGLFFDKIELVSNL